MKRLLFYTIMLTTIISCRRYPDYNKLTNNAMVLTNHQVSANFNSYKTYYMSDNLTLIGDDPKDTILSPSLSAPILNAIHSNMASRGFTRVPTSAQADLGLNPAAIKITTTVTTFPPSYWWGYPGYGGCYYSYCGYYPYYDYGASYGYAFSYSYSTGSLMIQMADLKNTKNNKLNIVWTNFNTGVLGNTTQNIQGGVDAVNQAFLQSDYIKTN